MRESRTRSKDRAEVVNTSDNESDKDEESSSEDEMELPELMVATREKRSGAGRKMNALLESALEDDFYKDAYGGAFQEDDMDDVFESPVHSDEDVVDSDFDRSENEKDDGSGSEGEDNAVRKSKRIKSREESDDKKKKWAVARMGGACVAANAVDEETQEEMLKEAEETEKINVLSLKKYEEFELEKKKKREKVRTSHKLDGPRVIERDNQENGKIIIYPSLKEFSQPHKKEVAVCAVTGRPARYRDSITGLPYSSAFAFKVIRDKYHKFLTSMPHNEQVSQYLAACKN